MFLERILPTFFIGVMLALSEAQAGSASLSLLPVDGLYGIPEGDQQVRSHVHPDFIRAIGYKGESPMAINGVFRESMQKSFAGSLVEQITPQNKYRTFAASLQVVRADQYAVNRPDGNVDIYLPLTLNLYFTNILSGEVLFSKSATRYRYLRETQTQYKAGESGDRIRNAYQENAADLVRELVGEASSQFNPLNIEAHILVQWEGFSVIDRGVDAGIGRGMELLASSGAGLKILHTEQGYAVGVPSLGQIASDDVLSFFSTSAAKDVNKPKVLVLDAEAPEELSGQFASIQFSENVGTKASFSVTPVNPTYQAVLQQIVRNGGLQQAEVTQKRALPDYFIRLKILPPLVYELASNQSFGKMRVFSVVGFAELIDRSGRVLYSTKADSEIKDQIIDGGMAFDVQDRYKVLFGNLLDTLSQRFIKHVRFDRGELRLNSVDDSVIGINDITGVLAPGQNVYLFRAIKSDKSDQVYQIPIWELTVGEHVGPVAKASYTLPLSEGKKIAPSVKDVVKVERGSEAAPSVLRLSHCNTFVDKGSVPARFLMDMGYFTAGSGLKSVPFYGAAYTNSTSTLLSENIEKLQYAGFSKQVTIEQPDPTHCLEPLAKINEIKRECSDDSLCEITVEVTAGWMIKPAGGAKPESTLMRVESQFEKVPKFSIDAYVSRRTMEIILELLPQTLHQVEKNLAKK